MPTLFKRRHIREVAPEVIPPGKVEPDLREPFAGREAEVPVLVPQPELVVAAPLDAEPAAPPEESAPEIEAQPEPRIVPADQYVVCEVRFWRGWRKGMFYAGMHEEDEDVAVAESAAFPIARGDTDAARTDDALAAYEGLRTALEAAGWERIAEGATWYAGTWRRSTDAEGQGQAQTPP